MKGIAVLTAVQAAHLLNNTTTSNNKNGSHGAYNGNMPPTGGGRSGRFEPDLHGNVNILLGGAMLGSVFMVVVFICYCCHRTINKHRPNDYVPYWRNEAEINNLEVFTMESHGMCFDQNIIMSGIFDDELSSFQRPVVPGPPPAYESLIFGQNQNLSSPSDKKDPNDPNSILPTSAEDENIPSQHQSPRESEDNNQREDEGLPSYEAALKLEANGYV